MAKKRKIYKKVDDISQPTQTEWVHPILTERALFTITIDRVQAHLNPILITNSLTAEKCDTTIGFFPLECRDYVTKVLKTEIPEEVLRMICAIGLAILTDKTKETVFTLEFKGE